MIVLIGFIIGFAVTLPILLLIRHRMEKRLEKRCKIQNRCKIQDVVTREMDDPFSQVMWAAFDSGKPVAYNGGDDFMTSYDDDGKPKKKIKLRK